MIASVTSEAPTYFIRIQPDDRGPSTATLSEGDSLPDHFVTDYQFIVSAQPIHPCGFTAIFCDGLESGDTTAW